MIRIQMPRHLRRNAVISVLAVSALAAARSDRSQQDPAGAHVRIAANAAAPDAPRGRNSAADVAALERTIEELTQRVIRLEAAIESLVAGSPREAPSVTAMQPLPLRQPRKVGRGELSAAAGAEPDVPGAGGFPQSRQPVTEVPAKHPAGLRFGGDFRLRLDGVVRPAHDPAAPGEASLPHVQNIRGRYRLRFNLDADVHRAVSFHGQLATGPVNNPLTLDQDFSGTVARHPFMVNEAWIDIHPWQGVTLQGGKVREVFADNLPFLFDDDVTFNGLNQSYSRELARPIAGFRRLELRSGQYVFSNPNVAVVTSGNLGPTGAVIGSTGRAAQMFHQGFILEQGLSTGVSHRFGADIQFYRNPNQIQFASTAQGVPIIVQDGLGIALAGPLKGAGNATTTPGGSVYSARGYQVARLSYRLDIAGLKSDRQEYPVTFNLQVSRNAATSQPQRDALLAALRLGRVIQPWSHSFSYLFAIKGANSLISQFTDDNLGTSSGVNIRAHLFRFDIGLLRGVQLQNLLFIQNELANSGQFPGFFVPLNAYTPRQYRFQQQVVFAF